MSSFDPHQPAQPDQPAQPHQQYAQPQYARPQQPQAPQPPQPRQQYAQPQPQQPQYAQSPPYAAPHHAQRAPGGLNVPGIIALAVLLLTSLIPLFTPVIYSTASSSGSFSAVSTVISIVHVLLLLIAGALAVMGLLAKHLSRWRWAAIGAAVSAALGLVSFVLSWFGGLLLSIPGMY